MCQEVGNLNVVVLECCAMCVESLAVLGNVLNVRNPLNSNFLKRLSCNKCTLKETFFLVCCVVR